MIQRIVDHFAAADDLFIGSDHGFHAQSVFTALLHEFIGRGERIGKRLFIFFGSRKGARFLLELGFFFGFDKTAADGIVFSGQEFFALIVERCNDQRVGVVRIENRRLKCKVGTVVEGNRLAAVEQQAIFFFDVLNPSWNGVHIDNRRALAH